MIWAMFKVYLNNPNYYVNTKGDPSTLTYGQLLKQCNII